MACACNVGDSLAYVYSTRTGHVREITQGSHDIQSNRDMRDALGALGPVDGVNPELSNLTCSMTQVESGDIVFITSDGVSDNFDPVVGKFCVPQRQERPHTAGTTVSQNPNNPTYSQPPTKNESLQNDNRPNPQNGKRPSLISTKKGQQMHPAPTKNEQMRNGSAPPSQPSHMSLPAIAAYQRHELTLLRMEDLLNNGSGSQSALPSDGYCGSGSGKVQTAAELCHRMVDFCQRLTVAKRKILEDPELYPEYTRHALPDSDALRLDQKMRRRKVCEKLALVPGKLDHATITAFSVADRTKSLQAYSGIQ